MGKLFIGGFSMENTSIGIAGMGVVGKAIYKGLSSEYTVFGYDSKSSASVNKIDDIIKCKFIFLCLPTPSLADGSADVSSIHNVISDIKNHSIYDNLIQKPIFVLKSTVPIGTTSLLEKKYMLNIVHCPEFLSARTSEIDFVNSNRIILGSNKEQLSNEVAELFLKRFPGIKIIKVSPEESEFIKYFLNCFYATKVTFFNEMRLLNDKLSLDWSKVMSGVLSSEWVEKMHTQVPGPDGKFGFGGACFPKDTSALSNIFKQNGLSSIVLDAVIDQNNRIRKE